MLCINHYIRLKAEGILCTYSEDKVFYNALKLKYQEEDEKNEKKKISTCTFLNVVYYFDTNFSFIAPYLSDL